MIWPWKSNEKVNSNKCMPMPELTGKVYVFTSANIYV
jgi:hypothetical protein